MARMYTPGVLAALSLATVVAQAQSPQGQKNLFTRDELTAVQEYWAGPNRYLVSYLTDVEKGAPWQAVYASKGSEWIYKYYKARSKGGKIVPTQDPSSNDPLVQSWDKWIDAKYEFDRFKADQLAFQANSEDLDTLVMRQTVMVKDPGQPPASLAALAGEPPKFFEASKPHSYVVNFDDYTVNYRDNVSVRRKYPYFRFNTGVNSGGLPVKRVPKEEMASLLQEAGLSKTESAVMGAVSPLEGGFDSVNTYDTGFVSVGMLQFASLRDGAGSLGAVLKEFKQFDPAGFKRDFRRFGVDVSETGVLSAVDIYTADEKQGHDANLQVIHDKRLVAVFQRAGLQRPFRIAQLRVARQMFYPAGNRVEVKLGANTVQARVDEIVKSEVGLATLMDRKVNTGGLSPMNAVLSEVAARHKAKTLGELARYESEIVTKMKYRHDFSGDPSLTRPRAVAAPEPTELIDVSSGGANKPPAKKAVAAKPKPKKPVKKVAASSSSNRRLRG